VFSILLTILPVFLILGTGYLAVKTGYLNAELSNHLNTFAVKLAVPVLLFRAMTKLDFSSAFHFPMLFAFYFGGIASFAIAIILARTVWQRRPGEAVAVGFCALFSNTVLLGIPIMQRSFGDAFMPPVFGIITFHAGLMYAIGMIAMELARADGRSLGETITIAAKSILANSLMIGVIVGILVNLSGFPLPGPVAASVDMIAAAAIPAALIGIGAALTRYELTADLSEALMVSFMALVVHPAIALFIAFYLFALPMQLVIPAVVVAAMPPGMNVYIFAVMYDRAVSLSASAIVIATSLSIFTISGWIWLLTHL
jgi:predicted permease